MCKKIVLKDYIFYLLYIVIINSKLLDKQNIVSNLSVLVNEPNENLILDLENFINFCYNWFEVLKTEKDIVSISDFFYLIECLETIKEILIFGNENGSIYFKDISFLYDVYEKDHLIIFKNDAIDFFSDWENN